MVQRVYGIDRTIRELKEVEPKAINALRKDLRIAAEPIAQTIKSGLPSEAPTRGMRHKGRTGWNISKISVKPKTNFSRRASARGYSIVSIWVGGKKGTTGAAGLQIADMSGRRGNVRTSGRTKSYTKNGVETSHRINGQGRGLQKKLRAAPSRYVWKKAEQQIPQISSEILLSLEKTSVSINKNLMVK